MVQRISLIALLAWCMGGDLFAPKVFAEQPSSVQKIGASGTAFSAIDGSVVSLGDFKGSVVLLHFFASWCGECILEAPTLKTLASSKNIPDVTIVGVAIEDTLEGAKAFAEAHKWPFPVIVDSEGVLKRRYAVRGVPSTMMLDTNGSQMSFIDPASGRKVSQVTGARDWASAGAEESLRKSMQVSSPDSKV